jgi:hypothetical protein
MVYQKECMIMVFLNRMLVSAVSLAVAISIVVPASNAATGNRFTVPCLFGKTTNYPLTLKLDFETKTALLSLSEEGKTVLNNVFVQLDYLKPDDWHSVKGLALHLRYLRNMFEIHKIDDENGVYLISYTTTLHGVPIRNLYLARRDSNYAIPLVRSDGDNPQLVFRPIDGPGWSPLDDSLSLTGTITKIEDGFYRLDVPYLNLSETVRPENQPDAPILDMLEDPSQLVSLGELTLTRPSEMWVSGNEVTISHLIGYWGFRSFLDARRVYVKYEYKNDALVPIASGALRSDEQWLSLNPN